MSTLQTCAESNKRVAQNPYPLPRLHLGKRMSAYRTASPLRPLTSPGSSKSQNLGKCRCNFR